MFLTPYRRRRLFRRYARPFLILTLLLTTLDTLYTLYSPPSPPPPISAIHPPPKLFIASMHWNNAAIIHSHWATGLLSLARYFGAENIYVSIVESGSWDDSKAALGELDVQLGRLGVERRILLEESTHEDEIERTPKEGEEGWIFTPRSPDKRELRRIPYLARIRNRVMEPLKTLATRKEGSRLFTHVLWLNDVIFSAEDVLRLLQTNNGSFAAACSLDFAKSPGFYDTFALRDASGSKPVSQRWPYFLDGRSRAAVMAGQDVLVQSCWNGIAAFDAGPFYSLDPHHRMKGEQGSLNFRGVPDSLSLHHLEGSESCLIHADNPLSAELGVWLNPHVRVAYNAAADKAIHPQFGAAVWPPAWERVPGIWANRIARIVGAGRSWSERWVVKGRIRKWTEEGERGSRLEKGVDCLVNEMQVLIKNGWAHV